MVVSPRFEVHEIVALIVSAVAHVDCSLGTGLAANVTDFERESLRIYTLSEHSDTTLAYFTALLQSGSFLAQADTNQDNAVSFADIPSFIASDGKLVALVPKPLSNVTHFHPGLPKNVRAGFAPIGFREA